MDIVLLDTGTGVTTNVTDGNGYPWYIDYTSDYIYWSDNNLQLCLTVQQFQGIYQLCHFYFCILTVSCRIDKY